MRDQLQPSKVLQRDLAKAEVDATAAHMYAIEEYEQACDVVDRALAQFELATAVQDHFRVSGELHGLMQSQAATDQILEKIAGLEEELAGLPAISDTKIRQLRSLSQKRGEADATLKAIATRIELIAADQTVLLNGKTLHPDIPTVIMESTEIRIGNGIRLLVRPGSGDGLSSATQKLHEIDMEQRREFNSLGISSLSEAEYAFTNHQGITGKIDRHRGELRGLNVDMLPQKIETLRSQHGKLAADIARRVGLSGADICLPETREAVDDFVSASKAAREQAEECVRDLKGVRDDADADRRTLVQKLRDHRAKMRGLESSVSEFEGIMKGLIQAKGDEETRQTLQKGHERKRDAAVSQHRGLAADQR